MTTHLEELLKQDISAIRDKVREMGDLALRALEDSVKALVAADTTLAYSCILRDSRIDDLESRVDSMTVDFMVRHIPVAAQLRFAHSVAKIVSELERVGDYSESISRQAIEISDAADRPDFEKFEKLAAVAIEMLRQALRSFLDEDIELAEETKHLDAKANRLHQEIYADLVASQPKTKSDMSLLFSLLSVANRFERVADQAGNICDEVAYIVSGTNVRHRLSKDIGILFVSSSNSCRSLMAEAIGRTIGGDHMEFSSAGVDAGVPDPEAVKFLTAMSIDVSSHKPTDLGSLGSIKQYKAVVALGAEAAEALPRLGYRTIALEWDVANPATDKKTSYEEVFHALVERVTNLIHSLHGTTSAALEEVTNK